MKKRSVAVDLSIVTLTWNSERHVRTCFERTAARAEEAGLSWEFLVVDNGSIDATPGILAELASGRENVWVHRFSENRGTTVPRNLALRRARGHYVCVLDSDAYPEPGCFETLLRVLEREPTTGIAVPRLVYPDGRYQKSTDRVPTLPVKVRRALFLRRVERAESAPPPGPVEYAISAFWLFRRDLLEQVGFLDENIFYAPEDVEFCLRVRGTGRSVWYEPSAVTVHDAQEKSRRVLPNRLTILHLQGLAYLFRKYRFLWSAPPLPAPCRETARETT